MATASLAPDPFSAFRLDGEVAIVTGASSGLGDRFARVLVAAGATVVAAARRADRLSVLAESVGGDRVVPVACDVSVPDEVERLVATALERCGSVDVLVNNAGLGHSMPAEDEPLEHFRSVMDVNVTGLWYVTQQCARVMLGQERGGTVVNVASMLGLVASGQIPQVSYCASKGAVVNLTRELAVQWARRGVRVNALAPGWFRSEMTGEMFDDEAGQGFIRRYTPMGRAGEPDELDGALLFLCSRASTFVTGQTLVVDGGWTAR